MKTGYNFLLGLCLALSGCGNDAQNQDGARPIPTTAILTFKESPIFDFGTKPVNTETQQVFHLVNEGTKSATDLKGTFHLSLNYGFLGGQYPGSHGTCGSTLSAGAGCTIVVVFHPVYDGVFEDAIHLTFNDGEKNTSIDEPSLRGNGF